MSGDFINFSSAFDAYSATTIGVATPVNRSMWTSRQSMRPFDPDLLLRNATYVAGCVPFPALSDAHACTLDGFAGSDHRQWQNMKKPEEIKKHNRHSALVVRRIETICSSDYLVVIGSRDGEELVEVAEPELPCQFLEEWIVVLPHG
jgi:hypothetical protein